MKKEGKKEREKRERVRKEGGETRHTDPQRERDRERKRTMRDSVDSCSCDTVCEETDIVWGFTDRVSSVSYLQQLNLI